MLLTIVQAKTKLDRVQAKENSNSVTSSVDSSKQAKEIHQLKQLLLKEQKKSHLAHQEIEQLKQSQNTATSLPYKELYHIKTILQAAIQKENLTDIAHIEDRVRLGLKALDDLLTKPPSSTSQSTKDPELLGELQTLKEQNAILSNELQKSQSQLEQLHQNLNQKQSSISELKQAIIAQKQANAAKNSISKLSFDPRKTQVFRFRDFPPLPPLAVV
jgi:hypothetical protein